MPNEVYNADTILLACPFCGGNALLRSHYEEDNCGPDWCNWLIECDSCGAQGPEIHCLDRAPQDERQRCQQQAIEAWNKRKYSSTVSRTLAADTSEGIGAENSTLRAAEVTPQVDTSTKNLKYWRERGGQIEWRLSAQRGIVRALEKDLAECDKNIKDLKNEALSHS